MSFRGLLGLGMPGRIASLLGALAMWAMSSAVADTTTLTLAGATEGTGTLPKILPFPVTRSGDLGYETILNYHTVDGTALAGVDYIAAGGSIAIPANVTSATIPVTLGPNTSNSASRQFQMVLDSAVSIGPSPTFSAQQTFGAGNIPYAVVAADVNGDGRPDLIVANLSNTVSILLNNTAPGASTPSFAAPQTFAAGNNPHGVTVADVNGDGKVDVIVANFNDNTVSLLLNTTAPGATTPSFSAQQTFATGTGPYSIAAADVNGDGKPDVIVANYLDNTVSVLLNTTTTGAATASLATQQTFASGSNPSFVTTADANGDGRPDLIVANLSSNTVSVLINTTAPGGATPGFAAQQSFATGTSPYSVSAADVNGDGVPDLVTANYGNNTVSVLLNTTAPGAASPSFAAQQGFATGGHPFSVSATDMNGDGKPDLIATNSGDNTVSVLLNTTAPGAATPSFNSQQTSAAGTTPYSVVAVNVNGDGKPDLIVANLGDNTVSVLLNTTVFGAAALNFATAHSFATLSEPYSVVSADVNGDGKPDLIAACYGFDRISVLLNTTVPGATAPTFASQQGFVAGTNPYSLTTADVNGDGKPDVIVANSGDSSVSVLLNNMATGASTASFGAQQSFLVGTNSYSLVAADVNGDGKPDVIVASSGDNDISVLLNTTAPGATAASFATRQVIATGTLPYAVAAADVNADGKPDLIVANYSDTTVSVLLNTTAPGASTSSFATQKTFPAGYGLPEFLATADVNGDGRPDLIVGNIQNNSVAVLLNTTAPGAATPSFAAQQSFAAATNLYAVTAADMNGDGMPDILVSDGNNIGVLLNTTPPGAATASFTTPQTYFGGGQPYSITTADVNGDGRPDLIAANSFHLDNTVSVLLSTQYQTVLSGSPSAGTIVHDYIFADGYGP